MGSAGEAIDSSFQHKFTESANQKQNTPDALSNNSEPFDCKGNTAAAHTVYPLGLLHSTSSPAATFFSAASLQLATSALF